MSLLVTLFEHINYQGRRRVMLKDTRDLGEQGFDNVVSSIKIDFQPGEDPFSGRRVATFYRDNDYGNTPILSLSPGGYRNIHQWGWGIGRNRWHWGDKISSLRFQLLKQSPIITSPAVDFYDHIEDLPVVLTVLNNHNGRIRANIIESVPRLATYLGPEFGDSIDAAEVENGPTFPSGELVTLRLYEHDDYEGQYLEYKQPGTRVQLFSSGGSLIRGFDLVEMGKLPDFGPYGFNGRVSSIQIIQP